MKKRILTAIVCVMIAFCFSGTTSANKNDYIIHTTSEYDFVRACNDLGEKYHICPELLESIGTIDSYFSSSYDITEKEVKKLYNLYVMYEDNYEVLLRYYKWSRWDDDYHINVIIENARTLEEVHGKV